MPKFKIYTLAELIGIIPLLYSFNEENKNKSIVQILPGLLEIIHDKIEGYELFNYDVDSNGCNIYFTFKRI